MVPEDVRLKAPLPEPPAPPEKVTNDVNSPDELYS